ncbi:MAG: hypothetical protein P0Y65_20290 [Candidatus Devosia phytovorans]|uniref:Uncharacterized protein n=1 Tax=Candidatus Devosia phytovorans TaxID=3121372 RepID=A0AAJ5VTF5_9HYPH|nr:hypothetical protein [Devosia sp.]WEK04484.1 MAG: hypothetical protein P0Y65_20290 [Devosia sp.]
MSNAIGTMPSVMINRIADREAPMEASLGKVAALRAELKLAMDKEQAAAEDASPSGEAPPPVVENGYQVDRLI